MTFSLRLSDSDATLFKAYAELNGMTVSELLRRSVLEHIEAEYDRKAYDQALADYQANPVTYSHDDVRRMLEQD